MSWIKKDVQAAEKEVPGMEEIQERLNQIERKDWWLWLLSILMLPLLATLVLVLTMAQPPGAVDQMFQFQIKQNAWGLLGIILIFCVYTIYLQTMLKRLRRQEAEHLFERSKLEIQAEVARQLAMLDPLTGVGNRRFLDHYLETEIPRSMRHNYPLTLLMFDLNDFKKINDQNGHPAGDLVLKEFTSQLKSALRSSDVLIRFGGDEFLAVLPDCTGEEIPGLLSRIKALSVDYHGRRIPFSFAAGSATLQPGETASQLIARADQAVYEDKRARKRAQSSAAAAVASCGAE
ncbi:MAG TPA: GGDEF domain-containing protein [Terriglobia bacterium]|nr:GGDEF domain-containing protein [Terriglobia bacterium]